VTPLYVLLEHNCETLEKALLQRLLTITNASGPETTQCGLADDTTSTGSTDITVPHFDVNA
jgi:hypothetical protein